MLFLDSKFINSIFKASFYHCVFFSLKKIYSRMHCTVFAFICECENKQTAMTAGLGSVKSYLKT